MSLFRLSKESQSRSISNIGCSGPNDQLAEILKIWKKKKICNKNILLCFDQNKVNLLHMATPFLASIMFLEFVLCIIFFCHGFNPLFSPKNSDHQLTNYDFCSDGIFTWPWFYLEPS
jgi:hypothetical protein